MPPACFTSHRLAVSQRRHLDASLFVNSLAFRTEASPEHSKTRGDASVEIPSTTAKPCSDCPLSLLPKIEIATSMSYLPKLGSVNSSPSRELVHFVQFRDGARDSRTAAPCSAATSCPCSFRRRRWRRPIRYRRFLVRIGWIFDSLGGGGGGRAVRPDKRPKQRQGGEGGTRIPMGHTSRRVLLFSAHKTPESGRMRKNT